MDFGKVKMPNFPVQVEYPIDKQKTYNIIASSLFMASHQKSLDSLALDLSKVKWANEKSQFNVTLISERNSQMKKYESESFHVVELDYRANDMVGENGPVFENMKKHENNIIEEIVREKNLEYL